MRISLSGAGTIMVISGLVTGCIAAGPALAGGDPVVSPGQLHGWHLATNKTVDPPYDAGNLNPSSTATYHFRTGPGHPPAGIGSLEMSTRGEPNSRVAAAPPDLAGDTLSHVHTVSYATYLVHAASHERPVNFKIAIASSRLGHFSTLDYEPARQSSPAPAMHEWQTWHPLSGEWWASRITGECSQSQPCSWSRLESVMGAASTIYGVYFELGDSGTGFTGITCALDKVDINGTSYDLEPVHHPSPGLHHHHRPVEVYCRAPVYQTAAEPAC